LTMTRPLPGTVASIGRLAGQRGTPKTAPVSREMILNYVGEHVLGLPRSY